MNLFSKMYEMAMRWAVHRHAKWYLMGLSFAESALLPLPPPDVMLAPMSLANIPKAWYFASITTISSVIGGITGYLIGVFAFELISPWLQAAGYMPRYELAVSWFEKWGFWVVFIAGFSPIPYKLFTIAAGVTGLHFIPFVLASITGRGARFFLVSGLMVWGGEKMEHVLRRSIDRIGFAVIIVAVIAYIIYEYT